MVARLRRAGAIVLGKTNTPEFLTSYETDNFLTGRTNNPWNLDRTPGGSSGGEAAAIASGCSPGGVGSDGGGSIRVPAHFCGIAGLKPTPGTHFDHRPSPGRWRCRNRRRRTHGALGGGCAYCCSMSWPDMTIAIRSPRRCRCASRSPQIPHRSHASSSTTFRCSPRFEKPCATPRPRFAGLGFTVDEFQPEGIERAPNLWNFFFGELPARAMKERIAGRENEAHWTYTEGLDRQLDRPPASAWQVAESLAARDAMRRRLVEQMRKFPVLLMPVVEHRRVPASRAAFSNRNKTDRIVSGHDDRRPPSTCSDSRR